MKWLMIPVGLTALLAGSVTFWLPIPIGLPLLLFGLYLLLKHSHVARRTMAITLRKSPKARAVYRRIQALKRAAARKRRQLQSNRANAI
jgi:hypothetical protein